MDIGANRGGSSFATPLLTSQHSLQTSRTPSGVLSNPSSGIRPSSTAPAMYTHVSSHRRDLGLVVETKHEICRALCMLLGRVGPELQTRESSIAFLTWRVSRDEEPSLRMDIHVKTLRPSEAYRRALELPLRSPRPEMGHDTRSRESAVPWVTTVRASTLFPCPFSIVLLPVLD